MKAEEEEEEEEEGDLQRERERNERVIKAKTLQTKMAGVSLFGSEIKSCTRATSFVH